MAHTHPGNEGDYLKHVVLEEVLTQASGLAGIKHIRYIDPYAGEGLFQRTSTTLHAPAGPAGKPQIWSNQQTDSEYYLGSPLIALKLLQRSGQDFSMRLSDSDFKAVAVLNFALQGGIPGYEPGRVPRDIVIQVSTFSGGDLGLSLTSHGGTVSVVLLDPTYSESYVTTIDDSVQACQASGSNTIVMCWGLQSWTWPASFTSIQTRVEAEYGQGKYQSVVHLLSFGPLSHQLASAALAAVQGW